MGPAAFAGLRQGRPVTILQSLFFFVTAKRAGLSSAFEVVDPSNICVLAPEVHMQRVRRGQLKFLQSLHHQVGSPTLQRLGPLQAV